MKKYHAYIFLRSGAKIYSDLFDMIQVDMMEITFDSDSDEKAVIFTSDACNLNKGLGWLLYKRKYAIFFHEIRGSKIVL